MKQDTQIAALCGMPPAQLRDKYLEVFGEPTQSGNREFLFKRLAWRIQSLAVGGLSERARRRAQELVRDAAVRLHSGARVASQHCPILRRGDSQFTSPNCRG
jgi:Protein of unknown function (DUF2924)